MTSWLHKQRKQTLLDLSSEAGLNQNEDLRKDELVEQLDNHLKLNATDLSRNATFEPYFGTRRTPFKARSSSAAGGATSDDGEVKSVVKARGRRPTKVKSETDDEDGHTLPSVINQASSAISQATSSIVQTARTPGRPRRRSELPPSPNDIVEDVEYVTNRLYSGVDDLITVSGVPERIEKLREICSSVTAVQMSILFLESWGIQRELLPFEHVFDIPSYHPFGGLSTPLIPVKLPDLFKLLSGHFWFVSLLWAATSIVIPGLFSYFYNLSLRDVKRHGAQTTIARYTYDPLIFNVVKALAAWMVYIRGYNFGVINEVAAESVDRAIFGGVTGIMIGSGIGVLVALYEAAQRK